MDSGVTPEIAPEQLSPTTVPVPETATGSKGLPAIAIAGIVVGVTAVFGAIAYFALSNILLQKDITQPTSQVQQTTTTQSGNKKTDEKTNKSLANLPEAPAGYEWYKNDKIAFLHLSKWDKESPLGTQIPVGGGAKFKEEFTYVGTSASGGTVGLQHYHSVLNDTPSIGADAAADRGHKALQAASSSQLMKLTQYSGHDSFMCASNFTYVDKLKRVNDAVSGKNGLEFTYTCDNANKQALKGAFGAYYDDEATLHVMYIVASASSWDTNRARVEEMVNSVILNP